VFHACISSECVQHWRFSYVSPAASRQAPADQPVSLSLFLSLSLSLSLCLSCSLSLSVPLGVSSEERVAKCLIRSASLRHAAVSPHQVRQRLRLHGPPYGGRLGPPGCGACDTPQHSTVPYITGQHITFQRSVVSSTVTTQTDAQADVHGDAQPERLGKIPRVHLTARGVCTPLQGSGSWRRYRARAGTHSRCTRQHLPFRTAVS
jgi:hypothetical protein